MHKVDFVLDKDHGDLSALILHFPLPFFHRLERISVSSGKSDHTSLSSPVVGLEAVYQNMQSARVAGIYFEKHENMMITDTH